MACYWTQERASKLHAPSTLIDYCHESRLTGCTVGCSFSLLVWWTLISAPKLRHLDNRKLNTYRAFSSAMKGKGGTVKKKKKKAVLQSINANQNRIFALFCTNITTLRTVTHGAYKKNRQ